MNFGSKNKRVIVLAVAGIMMNGILAHAAVLESKVQIEAGAVQGAPRDPQGVLAFKGIPYAAPPVGPLRWKSPQPVQAWEGIRDHTRFGFRCLTALQHDPEPGPPRSEDCLSLNVWTPAQSDGDKRPVIVWVHGGGFQFGSSASRVSDGSLLARKGVVVVSLNYRVGVLGFLAHPELDREGPSGDFGLQDQLAAFRWVKANIAKFGGDPDNVTAMGESAGAHAIGILMASPLSKGLFQKAIGESGAFWDGPAGPLESFDDAHARGEAFMRRMNVTSIAALRALPAEQLNDAATWNFSTNPAVSAFSPNIDRYVVPEVPAARYEKGEQLQIPLLAGWNDAEYWPFRAFSLPHNTAAAFRHAAEERFGRARMADFLALYPAGTDQEAAKSADALTGDVTIAEQTWIWLRYQQTTGHSASYGYKFTYTSPYVPIASHLVDVPFVFGTLTPQFVVGGKAPPAQADRDLSDKMMTYWANFATRGDPNGNGLPHWPAFSDGSQIMGFASSVGAVDDVLQMKRFRFIASFRVGGVLPVNWKNPID